ncbi:ATP-binding protein [Desulfobacterales bacterium HSG17]|nr:ATP-binding protein [Desulfobacterales bacterium HSG17]
MKIQYKVSLIIFAIGIITLLVISGFYYGYTHRISITENLKKLETLSEETAKHIQTHLEEKSTTAITLSSAPVIRQALKQSNKDFAAFPDDTRKQKIDKLNQKWMNTKNINDPFIQAHMTNSAAGYLIQQQELFPDKYGEIFLTNRFGVMIATTGKLTTLAHVHKYWWIAGYNDGKGRIFFDDRGFDASVKGYVLGIVVPVREKDEIIGILKCNINIQGALSHIVKAFTQKKYGTAKVLRSKGRIVIEPGMEPLSTQIPDTLVKELHRNETRSTIVYEKNDTEKFVAITPLKMTMGSKKYGFGGSYESIDHIKGNTGEGWYTAVFLDKKQIEVVTVKATRMLTMTGIFFILVISAAALILGRKIANPIILLIQSTKKIGKGDFDSRIAISSKDEIGMLAKSFNTMTDNLQREIHERELTIIERKKTEQLLQQAYADMEQRVNDRTQELAKANKELEIEITERKRIEYILRDNHNKLENRVEERTLELKKIHEQLLHAEKFSAIGSLSASIAHEFNNPLQGVMNIIKGVARRVKLDKDDAQLMALAISECHRMRDLIKSLQDFNRPTSGRKVLIDIHVVLDSLLLLWKKEFKARKINIETRFSQNMPMVKAVGDQIKQVFLNLLNNAADACTQEGTIIIETEALDEKVVVRISDTGTGIKPEHKDHLFEPFFSTKPAVKGTGLGLSVSYGIIREHGGEITLESEPGKGTTFSVFLPIKGGHNEE